MADAFLEARGISKAYEGVQALRDVSLTIGRGEVHCLVGENGSGKSTLIKIIGGVVEPDQGVVVIGGRPHHHLAAIDAIRQGIQIIYQDLSLYPNLSVAENISFNQFVERRTGFVSWKDMRAIAERGLAEIGERIDLEESVQNLSVAKRQIVAITRSLTQNAPPDHHGRAHLRHHPGGRGPPVLGHRPPESQGHLHPVHQPQAQRDLRDRRGGHHPS